MPESVADRAAAVARVLDLMRDEDASVKAAALNLLAPTERSVDRLWFWLVRGLVVLLAVALGAVIYLDVGGKSAVLAMTAFVSILSGLLGLFVGVGRPGS